jgi:P2 family phage major capsid protein
MRNETRRHYNTWLDDMARLNGAAVHGGEKFTVAPSVQQRLERQLVESSAMLSMINVLGVDEMAGQKIGLGIIGTLASRTNTATTDRATTDLSDLSDQGYNCKQTNFDSHISYGKLDAWAKFAEFKILLAAALLEQQALDRIMIGLNGTSAAATTNRTNNPLLQDVNIGWLQKIRTDAADQVFDEGATTGKVTYGPKAGNDYKTLDGLVYDNVQRLHPTFREDPRLRVFVGRSLMHDKLFPLVDSNAGKPTEAIATDVLIGTKRLGGLQPIVVPFMPAGTALVTLPKNLSLYYQIGARRRSVIDNPKRDRIETYDSSNDAYVVEQYQAAVLIENIEYVEA